MTFYFCSPHQVPAFYIFKSVCACACFNLWRTLFKLWQIWHKYDKNLSLLFLFIISIAFIWRINQIFFFESHPVQLDTHVCGSGTKSTRRPNNHWTVQASHRGARCLLGSFYSFCGTPAASVVPSLNRFSVQVRYAFKKWFTLEWVLTSSALMYILSPWDPTWRGPITFNVVSQPVQMSKNLFCPYSI